MSRIAIVAWTAIALACASCSQKKEEAPARDMIMKTAGAFKPRSETPLIRSILKAAADLKDALQRLPYDAFDVSGKLLASGQTSELSRAMPPGSYRIRIDALGQKTGEALTIALNETTTLNLGVDNDRFVIWRRMIYSGPRERSVGSGSQDCGIWTKEQKS